MTIFYPERFKQAQPAGFDGVFDWDFLRGAFGPVIMPMDIDGQVERNGRFLIFETKAPGVPIPRGQEIALRASVATGITTVVILYGKTPDTIVKLEEWHANRTLTHNPATAQLVWERAHAWFNHVNNLPPLTKEDFQKVALNSQAVSVALAEKEEMRMKLKIALAENAFLRERDKMLSAQWLVRNKKKCKQGESRQSTFMLIPNVDQP